MATATFSGSGSGSGNNGGFLGTISYGAQNVGDYLLVVAVSNNGLPGSFSGTTGSGAVAPGLIRFISLSNAYTQFGVYGGFVTTAFTSATYTWYASSDSTAAGFIYYVVVPSSGRSLLSPVTNTTGYNNILNISLTTTVAMNSGGIVFGVGGYNPEKSGGVERDNDTTDGDWSSVNTRLMPSGSWLQSQVFAQNKTVTGGATQTWNPVVTSTNNGTGVTALFTISENGYDPYWGVSI